MGFLDGILGGIFGGDSAPTYADTRVSPESTMTESQKAMQELLTNLGKMGYAEGMKYADPNKVARDKAFYNAMTAAIQNGGSRSPQAINGAMAAALNQNQTPTTQPTAPASTFTPDKLLDAASIYMNALKDQRAAGSMGGDPRSQAILRNAVPGSDNEYGRAAFALSQKDITQDMIDEYNRQKAQAEAQKKIDAYKAKAVK